MQKRAQFDDRIRNLLALAQDESEHSRSLLFSHISDLFLQERPMASDGQIRMLTEILKELLGQVALSTRKEIATALYGLTNPPEALMNIMCEDVVDISGPLLEKAILPDDRLIHIIRYGTEAHRIHISRRFGLSPLVRNALETAQQQSESSKLKYSLNELDKQAVEDNIDLDEETTANILELLRAQNIYSHHPDKSQDISAAPSSDAAVEPLISREPEISLENKTVDPVQRADISYMDHNNAFPKDIAANDAVLPVSNIHMESTPPTMDDDIWQQVKESRHETSRHREFARTIADWFWEVDRTGHISFISEEAFGLFNRPAPTLVGEDFISLCTASEQGGDTLESLFERRTSFRNIPFHVAPQNEAGKLWYMSAIAIFDIHTGRFTGFRGSAKSDIGPEITEEITTEIAGYKAPSAASSVSAHIENTPRQNIIPQTQDVPEISLEPETSHEQAAAELIQNLSHEFRTPLNAIIGFSEMIDMEAWGPVNEHYHTNIKNILTAAGQLKEAVNDVLDSARLESGLMQITPESFSLKSVMSQCRKNVEPMAQEKHIQILDNDNNIDVILYNDQQSVELCLTKMLASIIKRAAGEETIGPAILLNSNAQVRIELPFLGPRLRAENAREIFHKLENETTILENTPERDIKIEPKISSGFGLSIAQSLAQIIGGEISIHSTQGYVTHLVLTLSNHDPA